MATNSRRNRTQVASEFPFEIDAAVDIYLQASHTCFTIKQQTVKCPQSTASRYLLSGGSQIFDPAAPSTADLKTASKQLIG